MTSAFQFSIDEEGIAKVVFDLPGEKVNKFNRAVCKELDSSLDSLMNRKDIKALLFISGKKDIFIAGADLKEFLVAFKDRSVTQELLDQSRKTLLKLRSLPFPTIALIHGVCVGGGLEFALLCTYRIVTDHPKTSLSFPETTIGIFPGWGGTQTAPRLIGLMKATEMIVSGKPLNGVQAYKSHLADGIAAPEFLEEKGREFARTILTDQGRRKVLARRKMGGLKSLLLEKNPLGRTFLFSQFKKEILKKTKGFYPAPLIALDVIKRTCTLPIDQGLKIERDAFKDLDMEIPYHLISIFFGQENLKKNGGYAGELPAVSGSIDNAAVLGAGTMGGGIAYLFANSKIPARMKDINWELITKGISTSWELFQKNIIRKKLGRGEGSIRFHEISWTLDYEGLENKDFVLEAIVENIDLKHQVYQEVESAASNDAIIATNTSSLRVDDLCSQMKHPERFIGMHFFYPAPVMPLVEIIKGPKTSPEVFAKTLDLAKKLGKVPLVVKDCNGFLVNRILLTGAFEAFHLLEEGASIEEVDQASLSFGLPMGSCEVIDFSGIDVVYHVAHVFQKAYGDRMSVPALLNKLYYAKLLGKKTGKGFYLYKGKEKKINPEAVKLIQSVQTGRKATAAEISERSLLAMINEASRCLEEGIVSDPSSVDLALVLGSGFPPFRGGLLAYADKLGIKTVYDKLKSLESVSSTRFKPTQMIETMAANNQTFYKR